MTFRISGTLVALAVLVAGHEALAGDFNYTYVQASLLGTRVKSGGDSDNGNGFRLKGLISNDSPLFGSFDFATNKYSSRSDDLKFSNVSVGLGAHLPLGPNVDLIGGASFERLTMKPHIAYSPNDTKSSRSGLGLMAGMRAQTGALIEWSASAKYRRMEKIHPVVGVTIGGRYLFTPALSVAVDASFQKYDKKTLDATESMLELGLRYQFGAGT
jgi:hypothetical protein